MIRAHAAKFPGRLGELGYPKAPSISARRHADGALEQAAEEGRVLVAHAPADLVDRAVGAFQPALGFLHPQALHVSDRGQAGGGGEAALEGAFGQARAADHLLDRIGDREVLTQPALRGEDLGAADRIRFEVATAVDYPSAPYGLICFVDCLHDLGDPVAAARHAADTLALDGTVLLVEPFANDRVAHNRSSVGRLYYAASTTICCAHAIAEGGQRVLGAQAGEARLAEVFRKAGFGHFRRAAETPFNLILEARRKRL